MLRVRSGKTTVVYKKFIGLTGVVDPEKYVFDNLVVRK
jgi:hypothetical protein